MRQLGFPCYFLSTFISFVYFTLFLIIGFTLVYFCLYYELLFNFTDLSDSSIEGLLIPIYNADTDKQKILKENKGKSGVYMLTNLINGKRYVGSSENLSRRFTEYLNINYLMRNGSMYILVLYLNMVILIFLLQFLSTVSQKNV
jgi:hypothetical protein